MYKSFAIKQDERKDKEVERKKKPTMGDIKNI